MVYGLFGQPHYDANQGRLTYQRSREVSRVFLPTPYPLPGGDFYTFPSREGIRDGWKIIRGVFPNPVFDDT